MKYKIKFKSCYKTHGILLFLCVLFIGCKVEKDTHAGNNQQDKSKPVVTDKIPAPSEVLSEEKNAEINDKSYSVNKSESGRKSGKTLSPVAPKGFGQLETAPVLFKGGVDKSGREFYLNGQKSKNNKLIFTASNGFFSPGVCRAEGTSTLPKVGDDNLIKPNYASLGRWRKTSGDIRWHVWLARAGKVRFNVHMKVTKSTAGSKVKVSFAGADKKVQHLPPLQIRPNRGIWSSTLRRRENILLVLKQIPSVLSLVSATFIRWMFMAPAL